MRIMNLVLCDDGKNDKTIRALASDGKLYDIADISKDLFDILVATRIREDLQVDGNVTLKTALNIASGGTGATSPAAAANTLKLYGLRERTALPEGIDLNNYTTTGNYCSLSNAISKTLKNSPTSNAFIMTVFTSNGGDHEYTVNGEYIYIGQEIKEFNTGVTFFRMFDGYSGTWYNWSSTYSDRNIPLLSNLSGTLPTNKGGTGATTASDALANLGGLPKSYAGLVSLWYGSQGSGTITIPNARLYNSLLFVGSPGSGETLTSLVLGGTFTGSYQLTSNEAYLVLKLSNSGNNTVVQVDASAYNGYLSYVFGIVRTT